MWWMTLFCGLIATIVTSYKVFDKQEAPINLSEFPGEYKRVYWFEYPECKDIKANAEAFEIVGPSKSFVNTCNGEKKTNKCYCRVPLERKSLQYDVSNCINYGAHPLGQCNLFTICGGSVMFIMMCGAGTVFNPKNKACDHPDRVKCPKLNINGTKPPCSFFNVKVGHFPDLNSGCKSYFVCQFGIIGKEDCEGDLIFDTWTHRCNDPDVSICGCNIKKPATC